MIAKKNPKVDMERKRVAIFNVGLLVAGSFTLAAFTYTETSITEEEKLAVAVDENITFVVTEKEPEPVIEPQQRTQQTQTDQQDQQQQNLGSETAVSELTTSRDNGNEGPKLPGGPGDFGFSFPGGKVNVAPVDPIKIPDIDAQYIGGRQAMMEQIVSVQQYPEIDRELGIQGKVYVSFVVEKDGTITNVKTERGVSETLDREAVRIVKTFPKWKPGEDKYGVVRTRVRMPIVFILHN